MPELTQVRKARSHLYGLIEVLCLLRTYRLLKKLAHRERSPIVMGSLWRSFWNNIILSEAFSKEFIPCHMTDQWERSHLETILGQSKVSMQGYISQSQSISLEHGKQRWD